MTTSEKYLRNHLRAPVREHGLDEKYARFSLDLVQRDHEHIGETHPLRGVLIHLLCPPSRPLVARKKLVQTGLT